MFPSHFFSHHHTPGWHQVSRPYLDPHALGSSRPKGREETIVVGIWKWYKKWIEGTSGEPQCASPATTRTTWKAPFPHRFPHLSIFTLSHISFVELRLPGWNNHNVLIPKSSWHDLCKHTVQFLPEDNVLWGLKPSQDTVLQYVPL